MNPILHWAIAAYLETVFFYSSDVAKSTAKVKYVKKAKYEKNLLVWAAISSKGISKIFIVPSGQAFNQHIYKEECLQRRLIPFIKKYHQEDEFIFWPDLASPHYAETVCDFMIESKINFVEKYENPENLPECRPIEQFWAILKSIIYSYHEGHRTQWCHWTKMTIFYLKI